MSLQGSVPSAIGSRHTAIRYLQSHDCIDKLKRNMREEHVLKLDWISTLFKHVSWQQCAACCCNVSMTANIHLLSVWSVDLVLVTLLPVLPQVG